LPSEQSELSRYVSARDRKAAETKLAATVAKKIEPLERSPSNGINIALAVNPLNSNSSRSQTCTTFTMTAGDILYVLPLEPFRAGDLRSIEVTDVAGEGKAAGPMDCGFR
jgi:hypothetical protein